MGASLFGRTLFGAGFLGGGAADGGFDGVLFGKFGVGGNLFAVGAYGALEGFELAFCEEVSGAELAVKAVGEFAVVIGAFTAGDGFVPCLHLGEGCEEFGGGFAVVGVVGVLFGVGDALEHGKLFYREVTFSVELGTDGLSEFLFPLGEFAIAECGEEGFDAGAVGGRGEVGDDIGQTRELAAVGDGHLGEGGELRFGEGFASIEGVAHFGEEGVVIPGDFAAAFGGRVPFLYLLELAEDFADAGIVCGEPFHEFGVEAVDFANPVEGAVGDFVEGGFHVGGEVDIDEIGHFAEEVFGDADADIGGGEDVAFTAFDVGAGDEGADGGGVGGGAADAALFHGVDEGGFVIAGWRLSLFGFASPVGFQNITDGQLREGICIAFIGIAAGILPYFEVAFEDGFLSGGGETVGVAGGRGGGWARS